jgi:hypothetical protein
MTTNNNTPGPKVFDVARPGDSAPGIGSKPMIVGHRTLAEDPMVRDNTDKKADDIPAQPEPKLEAPSATKKVVTPVSEQSNTSEETAELEETNASDTVEKAEAVAPTQQAEVEPKNSQPEEQEVAENQSDNEKKIDPSVEQMERDENIKKMVESKKYFVTIHDSQSSSSMKTFAITFVIALLVGLAIVTVLIDADILDIGITLPVDFL